jgi:hypothetical protein
LFLRKFSSIIALTLVSFLSAVCGAQANPTAGRSLEISAFGGLTGTYTGISGGKNLGITAGVDVGLRPFFGFRPYLEGRGTIAIDSGHIDKQKDALGGLRLEHKVLVPGLRAYGDFLIGRGQIDYENGGYPSPTGPFLYVSSVSTVISPGAGLEFRLTDHFSALADVQFQHWDTPVTPSGAAWAKPLTLGVRYHFNFNRKGYAAAESSH